MKKSLLLLIPFILPACFKKRQVNVQSSQKPCNPCSEWRSTGGTVKFDDDVDEFFLEEDEEDNVFEQGLKVENIADQELEMATLPLEEQITEVIQFDYDKTNINPEERDKIQRNADYAKDVLKDDSKALVVVGGHSCKLAKSQTYNYMISQERAEHVAQEYIKNGVPENKVKAVGHGSSELLTNADGKEAQAINRRAETKFIS